MKTIILLCGLLPALTFTSDFYIAPDGNDVNAGTIQKPFRTLEGARDAIRNCKNVNIPDGKGITVWIRGGIYERTQPFELNEQDSGTRDKQVIYRAYNNENVQITGGKELPISDFRTVKSAEILKLLNPDIRNKVVQFDLFGHGIKNPGKIEPIGVYNSIVPTEPEIFFNDKPMTLARWPNAGWAKTGVLKSDAEGSAAESNSMSLVRQTHIAFQGDHPTRWLESEETWLVGFWKWDWCDSAVKVSHIDRARKRFIIAGQVTSGVDAERRYYAYNLLEELDLPGEYYIDRRNGILYFLAPDNLAGSKVSISLLESPLIVINGAKNIIFDRITFECTRGTAIHIVGGSNNVINMCTIRNCGNLAVNIGSGTDNGTAVGRYMAECYANSVWNRNAGFGNGVTGCDIYNTGEGGIILGGGDRKTLSRGGNFVRNNRIHNFSNRTHAYRPAIAIDGVGNIAANNLIYDGPHSGVIFCGNDHSIEYNELHDLCTETGDVGAIYTGRDITARGSVIKHNYIHDIEIPGACAIYLDDMGSGIEVSGNLIYKVQMAMLIGGGLDNSIENNLIIDCNKSVQVDDRGRNAAWFKPHITAPDGVILKRLNAVPYKENAWRIRYPKLACVLDENEPFAPKGNVVRNNITIRSEAVSAGIVDSAAKYGSVSHNLNIKGDPNSKTNYSIQHYLQGDSCVFKSMPDFKPIPITRIGIYKE